jgi:SNF2 family DNA or RNA helicase
MENQAFDRVYRIGQTRPVRVVRFLMSSSVEERLIAVQEAKQALGNGSLQKLTKAEQEKAKLTTIRDLFEIAETDDADWDWLD